MDYADMVAYLDTCVFWGILRDNIVSSDLDGVLCVDGSPQTPRVLPPFKLHEVITGRAEKWRKVTVDWLSRHGVEYGELVMIPNVTMDREVIAKFKAEVYSRSKADVFVESCPHQTVLIRELTGKTVITPD